VAAGLGWATGPGPGLFYEVTGEDPDDVRERIEAGLDAGSDLRDWELPDREVHVETAAATPTGSRRRSSSPRTASPSRSCRGDSDRSLPDRPRRRLLSGLRVSNVSSMNGNNPYAGAPGVTTNGASPRPSTSLRIKNDASGARSPESSREPNRISRTATRSAPSCRSARTGRRRPSPSTHRPVTPSRPGSRRTPTSWRPASPTPTPTRSPADWPRALRCR